MRGAGARRPTPLSASRAAAVPPAAGAATLLRLRGFLAAAAGCCMRTPSRAAARSPVAALPVLGSRPRGSPGSWGRRPSAQARRLVIRPGVPGHALPACADAQARARCAGVWSHRPVAKGGPRAPAGRIQLVAGLEARSLGGGFQPALVKRAPAAGCWVGSLGTLGAAPRAALRGGLRRWQARRPALGAARAAPRRLVGRDLRRKLRRIERVPPPRLLLRGVARAPSASEESLPYPLQRHLHVLALWNLRCPAAAVIAPAPQVLAHSVLCSMCVSSCCGTPRALLAGTQTWVLQRVRDILRLLQCLPPARVWALQQTCLSVGNLHNKARDVARVSQV